MHTEYFALLAVFVPDITHYFCVESMQSLSTAGKSKLEQFSPGPASIILSLIGKVIRFTLFVLTGSSMAEYI